MKKSDLSAWVIVASLGLLATPVLFAQYFPWHGATVFPGCRAVENCSFQEVEDTNVNPPTTQFTCSNPPCDNGDFCGVRFVFHKNRTVKSCVPCKGEKHCSLVDTETNKGTDLDCEIKDCFQFAPCIPQRVEQPAGVFTTKCVCQS